MNDFNNNLVKFLPLVFFKECDKWKYGSNCESNCSCDVMKTEFCNPITGICKCKSGWNGTHCQDDVNECEKESSCQGNSTCNNTIGSFDCTCNLGYTETEEGLCAGLLTFSLNITHPNGTSGIIRFDLLNLSLY